MPPNEPPPPAEYIVPTSTVIRDASQTTRVRVVLDAAAPDPATGRSINDALCAGPKLINDFQMVLIGFHHHSVALTGDVSEMFM